jgi:SAM-dependent methyltransferase
VQHLRVRALLREKVLRHSTQAIFTRIYRKNSWGNAESVSGDGSDLNQTLVVRRELPALLAEFEITSILDVPCGDYHWMKEVDIGLRSYVGGDIVPELIEANQCKYGSATRRFAVLDITLAELPRMDAILCRDCLVHLPLDSAVDALGNCVRSGARYLLTTTYPGLVKRNKQLFITGNWRPLDLRLPPFSLPKPIRLINEECTEKCDYKEKSLGLWKLAEMRI